MAYNRPLIDPNMFFIMYYYNIQYLHKYYLKPIRFYIAIGLALGRNMFVTTVVL